MKKNTRKVLSVCTVASVLIASSVASVTVKAAGVTPPENTNGYEPAVKASQAGGTSNSYYTVKLNGKELKLSTNSSSKKDDKKEDKKDNKKGNKNDNRNEDQNEDQKNGNNGEQNLRLFDAQVRNLVQYVEQKHPQGLHAIADVSQSNHKLTIELANPNATVYGAYSKFMKESNLQNNLQSTLFNESNGYSVTKVVKAGYGNIYDANVQDKTVSDLIESIVPSNESTKYKDLKGNYKVYLKYKGKDIKTPYIVEVH